MMMMTTTREVSLVGPQQDGEGMATASRPVHPPHRVVDSDSPVMVTMVPLDPWVPNLPAVY